MVFGSLLFVTFGAAYTFPQFFPHVKKILGLTENQLNLAGTGFYVGSNVIGYFVAPIVIEKLGNVWGFFIGSFICPLTYYFIARVTCDLLVVGTITWAFFFLIIGISNGIVFPIVTQVMINLWPPEYTNFCVALPCMMHAFGGFLMSFIYSILPNPVFFAFVLVSQIVMCSLVLFMIWYLTPAPVDSSETKTLIDKGFTEVTLSSKAVLKQLLLSFSFHLVAGIVFVLIGCGATIMTNLGPLAQSLGLDSTSSTIVSNAAQTIGRFGVTLMYISYSQHYITIDLSIVIALMYLGMFLLFATADEVSEKLFYTFNVVFGISYGAGWTVAGNFAVYTVRPEPKYWSTVSSVVYPFSGFGTLIFNYILGQIYDAHSNGAAICLGIDCYRESFWILAASALVVVAALAALRLLSSPRKGGAQKAKFGH